MSLLLSSAMAVNTLNELALAVDLTVRRTPTLRAPLSRPGLGEGRSDKTLYSKGVHRVNEPQFVRKTSAQTSQAMVRKRLWVEKLGLDFGVISVRTKARAPYLTPMRPCRLGEPRWEMVTEREEVSALEATPQSPCIKTRPRLLVNYETRSGGRSAYQVN
jgi:hypothetical protein